MVSSKLMSISNSATVDGCWSAVSGIQLPILRSSRVDVQSAVKELPGTGSIRFTEIEFMMMCTPLLSF